MISETPVIRSLFKLLMHKCRYVQTNEFEIFFGTAGYEAGYNGIKLKVALIIYQTCQGLDGNRRDNIFIYYIAILIKTAYFIYYIFYLL